MVNVNSEEGGDGHRNDGAAGSESGIFASKPTGCVAGILVSVISAEVDVSGMLVLLSKQPNQPGVLQVEMLPVIDMLGVVLSKQPT